MEVTPVSSSTLMLADDNQNEFDEIPRSKRPRPEDYSSDDEEENDPSNSNKEGVLEDSDGIEGCPICFEPWTTSGIHRVCSLRCGHVFGKHCIETWLTTGGRSKCPQCNLTAHRKEIRVLYVKNLAAVDNSEKDAIVKQLEEERALRKRCQERETKLLVSYNFAIAELNTLKERMAILEKKAEMAAKAPFSLANFEYRGSAIFENDSLCRGMTVDVAQRMFLIGTGKNSSKGRLFGVSKVSALDLTRHEFVPLHDQLLKNIASSPYYDGLLLSTSFDKTIKLSSTSGNTVLLAYKLDAPGWSCDFDKIDRNIIYVGQADGVVTIFDVRNTRDYLRKLSPQSNGETIKTGLPIHSLFVREDEGHRILLMANMETVTRIELDNTCKNNVETWDLPKSCSSLALDATGRYLLTSTRGTNPLHTLWLFSPEGRFSQQTSWTGQVAQSSIVRAAISSNSANPYSNCAIIPDGNKAIFSIFRDNQQLEERVVNIGSSTVNILDCTISNFEENQMMVGLLTERQLSLYTSFY